MMPQRVSKHEHHISLLPTFVVTLANFCYGAAGVAAAVLWVWDQISSLPTIVWSATIGLFVLGLLCHMIFVVLLLKGGAEKREPFVWSPKLLTRLAGLFVSPGRVRWHTLHHRLYDRKCLGDLDPNILLYLSAVDLNTGREIAFSRRIAGWISSVVALERLWAQKPGEGLQSNAVYVDIIDRPLGSFRPTYDVTDLPLALAVAASSAYPIFFPSVDITLEGSSIGNFIDGGLLDNYALDLPRRMAKEITHERAVPHPSFTSATSWVLPIDATAPFKYRHRHIWRRYRTVRRAIDISYEPQTMAVYAAAEELESRKVLCRPIGLKVGVPVFYEEVGIDTWRKVPAIIVDEKWDTDIARLALQIRTHFDGFSATECAVLAFLGYLWTEYWARSHYFPGNRRHNPPLCTLRAILPEEFSQKITDDRKIVDHLRFSHLRIGAIRAMARLLWKAVVQLKAHKLAIASEMVRR